MAHTNHSNGAADDFEALAGAPHWEKALGQFGVSGDKRLRVNFGHFGHGGTPGMVAPTMSERFVSLMTDQRGGGAFTFADASYFSEILDDRDRLKNILISLYLSKANNNPGLLAARLMYGSDWEMCIPESNVGDYFTEFQILYGEIGQQLRQSQGDSWAGLESKFFGINAVHYLGLRRGELTRKRIERFFAGKPQPSWMTKVDRLPAI
jgi:hypothetical protein